MKNSSSLIFFIISFLFTLFILFTFPEFEIHHTNFTELVSLFFYAVTVSAAAGLVNFYFSSRYAQSRTDRFKKLIQKYFPQETAQERKSKNSMYSSAFFIKNTELWMQNISKKVQLLSLDRELFLSLLNGLEEGIFCVEKSGRILFQNKMIDPDLMVSDATGKPFFQAIRNSSILEHVHKMLAQINEKNLSSSEDHNLEIQTSGKFYKMICHPISSDSETEMILYLILDETESRLSEKTKEDFFMNAGHELKTPITSIQGYAETISDKCTNPDLKRFIEPILRNIYRMNRLVQDMTSLSSIASKFYPFHPEKIIIPEFMKNLNDLAEGILKRKNQTLLITLPESYPDLHADPLLLEHLMSNLIQNASRHSPEHTSIHIKISVYNQNFMEIQVEDRGSGIQPEHRDKIFERFFRSDRNRSREEGGTGLGLSIAKQIVEMHGGSISASNSDQGGAVIRFTLKFNPE